MSKNWEKVIQKRGNLNSNKYNQKDKQLLTSKQKKKLKPQ